MIGEQEVYICLTEFQKHRLPHGHLLSIAAPESGEIYVEWSLWKTESKSICCNKGGVCKKLFPKEFFNETNANLNGYPQYRQWDN